MEPLVQDLESSEQVRFRGGRSKELIIQWFVISDSQIIYRFG